MNRFNNCCRNHSLFKCGPFILKIANLKIARFYISYIQNKLSNTLITITRKLIITIGIKEVI